MDETTNDRRPLLAVVGAGIGGLALANAAQQWGARVVVFERDTDFDVRSQGYGLTMQQGGSALRALGLYGTQAERSGKQCITASLHLSFASDGRVLGRYGHRVRQQDRKSGDGPNPHTNRKQSKASKRNFLIPRQCLRQELLDSLPPRTVRWGCNFESYSHSELEPDGTGVLLHFGAGKSASGAAAPAPCLPVRASVLVGADGIYSRVARQRLSAKSAALEYSGVLVVLGIAALNEDTLSSHELVAGCDTVTETVGGTSRLYTMPFSRSHHMWQLSVPMSLVQAQALHKAGPEALLSEAQRICDGWHDPLPSLLKATAVADVTGYPVFDRTPLPPSALRPVRVGHSEDRLVTILGDALHPMAPFKGQGANTALQDGVQLAGELEHSAFGEATRAAMATSATSLPKVSSASAAAVPSSSRSTEDALSSFEAACLSYSAVKVQTSRVATSKLHGVASHEFMKARQHSSNSTDDSHAWRSVEQSPEVCSSGASKRKRRQAKQVQTHFQALRESEDEISQVLAVGKLVHVLSRNKTSEYLAQVTSAPRPGGTPDSWGVKAVRPDTRKVSRTAVEKWVHQSHCRTAKD